MSTNNQASATTTDTRLIWRKGRTTPGRRMCIRKPVLVFSQGIRSSTSIRIWQVPKWWSKWSRRCNQLARSSGRPTNRTPHLPTISKSVTNTKMSICLPTTLMRTTIGFQILTISTNWLTARKSHLCSIEKQLMQRTKDIWLMPIHPLKTALARPYMSTTRTFWRLGRAQSQTFNSRCTKCIVTSLTTNTSMNISRESAND